MRLSLYLLATLLLAASLLIGCAERTQDPAAPEPATTPETAQTPLGAPDPGLETEGTVSSSAQATLEPVGGSGVRGQMQLHQMTEGVHIVAEVGGGPDGDRALRVLTRRDCTDPSDTSPLPDGNLGTVETAFDGTGQYEQVHRSLRLDGDRSVVGRAAAVLSGGGEVLACGVIRASPL